MREQFPCHPPQEDFQGRRLEALRESNERALEDPSADLGNHVFVLGVGSEGQYLAAAHAVAGNEDGNGGGQLGADDRYDVGDDEGRWPRVALVGKRRSAAAPAPLVKPVCCDAVVGEVGEESIVAVYVVIEAMDEDELCLRGAVGLGGSWSARA